MPVPQSPITPKRTTLGITSVAGEVGNRLING